MAIISVIASIAIPSLYRLQLRSRAGEAKVNLAAIRTAEEVYMAEVSRYVAFASTPQAMGVIGLGGFGNERMAWAPCPTPAGPGDPGHCILGWQPDGLDLLYLRGSSEPRGKLLQRGGGVGHRCGWGHQLLGHGEAQPAGSDDGPSRQPRLSDRGCAEHDRSSTGGGYGQLDRTLRARLRRQYLLSTAEGRAAQCSEPAAGPSAGGSIAPSDWSVSFRALASRWYSWCLLSRIGGGRSPRRMASSVLRIGMVGPQ